MLLHTEQRSCFAYFNYFYIYKKAKNIASTNRARWLSIPKKKGCEIFQESCLVKLVFCPTLEESRVISENNSFLPERTLPGDRGVPARKINETKTTRSSLFFQPPSA